MKNPGLFQEEVEINGERKLWGQPANPGPAGNQYTVVVQHLSKAVKILREKLIIPIRHKSTCKCFFFLI